MINNGFDAANLLIHSSLDEMKEAFNWVVKVNEIDINSLENGDCSFHSPKIENIDKSISKHLIKAIVLFQAGMESIIHWIGTKDTTIKSSGSFVFKWEYAFEAKNIKHDFSEYANFYRSYRIHLIHPDKEERFETFNNLIFSDVYQGLLAGWNAFYVLSGAIGHKHDEESWQIMCAAHGLPGSVQREDYVSPKEVISHLDKKYRIYLDSLTK